MRVWWQQVGRCMPRADLAFCVSADFTMPALRRMGGQAVCAVLVERGPAAARVGALVPTKIAK